MTNLNGELSREIGFFGGVIILRQIAQRRDLWEKLHVVDIALLAPTCEAVIEHFERANVDAAEFESPAVDEAAAAIRALDSTVEGLGELVQGFQTNLKNRENSMPIEGLIRGRCEMILQLITTIYGNQT